MKENKKNFLKKCGLIVAILLIVAAIAGCIYAVNNSPEKDVISEVQSEEKTEIEEIEEEKITEPSANETEEEGDEAPSDDSLKEETKKQEEPPRENNRTEEAQKTEVKEADNDNGQLTCTLSVRCDTLLKNIDKMSPEKAAIVPANGIIFNEQKVVFYEGESVFNVLKREMRSNKIHMEFENAPIYGSAYIEAIGNLYEFDCGELSGWMYRVNGVYPNYGCSKYVLHDGDRVEWIYTCDLGRDIGGGDVPGNGRNSNE